MVLPFLIELHYPQVSDHGQGAASSKPGPATGIATGKPTRAGEIIELLYETPFFVLHENNNAVCQRGSIAGPATSRKSYRGPFVIPEDRRIEIAVTIYLCAPRNAIVRSRGFPNIEKASIRPVFIEVPNMTLESATARGSSSRVGSIPPGLKKYHRLGCVRLATVAANMETPVPAKTTSPSFTIRPALMAMLKFGIVVHFAGSTAKQPPSAPVESWCIAQCGARF